MNFPANVRYSPAHTWARLEDDGTISVGITDFAQYELGELQYVGLPRVGSSLTKDAPFGEVETSKTAADLHAPCSGCVLAVNAALDVEPQVVNRDPYGAGWIVRIAPSRPDELDELLAGDDYERTVAAEGH